MRARWSRVAVVSSFVMLTAAGAARSKTAAKPAPDAPVVDVSAVKDKLEILSDGKKHYVALVPFDDGGWRHVYYGDGAQFYALRVIGSGAEGHASFDFTFWEPRVKARYQAELTFKADTYEVECDTRQTTLTPLPAPTPRP